MAPSHSQPKKAPTKPMWVDVSVLPRIPKIKRESSSVTNNGTNRGGSSRNSNSRGSSSSSTTNHGYGLPEMGINSLAGDKTRQQSVDQQRGRSDGQAQRHRSDGAGSSSTFSNSFSSSSSSAGSQASQSRHSSSSSSSAAVSFRINSSGNSWHSRRLSITSPSTSGGSMQEPWRGKEDEARKRQLHRDKQMLLASRTLANKEQDSNNIYDPFNPTLSDSSSSDGEAGSSSLDSSSRNAMHERKAPSLGNKEDLLQRKEKVHVKSESQETEVSRQEPQRSNTQETISPDVKEEKKSRLIDIKVEKQTILLDTKIKKEPGVDDAEEAERCGHSAQTHLNSETAPMTQTAHHSLVLVKTEKETLEEPSGQREGTPNIDAPNCKNNPSASTKKQKVESKLDSTTSSKLPPNDLAPKKKTSKASKEQRSSSSEMDRGRRGDHHSSDQGDRQKEKKNKERSSRRSRSREKMRARSTSESSQSNSPDRTSRKRQRSRSRSKGRRRSSSSSRERSRGKKHKQRSKERNDDDVRERDHERRWDISGAASDPSKKGAVGAICATSEGLSSSGQGESEEGDLSRKDKYLKKLHMQERAIEEVKLAIKPFYQKRDINKDEYKEILRKAVQKVCHSKSGEINPVKVGNLVKAYVDKYKHARKHRKGEDSVRAPELSRVWFSHMGVAGAGKHMAPVQSPGIDTSLLDLQQQTLLDTSKDATY
ncbi:hypothetical protein INR49_030178 [Caranx melampygus]|nr:hypothetical protein INR49_030178 [Caranx melampygus]